MKCLSKSSDGEAELLNFAAGRRVTDAAALREHFSICETCRTKVAAQQSLWGTLDQWEPVEPSFTFDRTLYARIEKERESFFLVRWWRSVFQGAVFVPRQVVPVAAVVAVAVALFATDIIYQPAQPTATGKTEPVATYIDAEQLSAALDDLQLLNQLDTGQPVTHHRRPVPRRL